MRVHTSVYGNCIVFVCYYKILCVCVLVFVFQLSGTFSRGYPYPATVTQQATQREKGVVKPV